MAGKTRYNYPATAPMDYKALNDFGRLRCGSEIRVMIALAAAEQPLNQNGVIQTTGLSCETVFRALRLLVEDGYVAKEICRPKAV